ncbi:DMT family transporter [Spirochaeta cellobiosiphila]|uniref:DMT family transporter n=1 Tax=Spirochaeta cellobiosiphila TaxID=504483 RepID=UPI000490C067|nr:DMT family transporter [Spirochaeta cellobiosiphila]
MIILFIILAFINGFLVITSRSLNAQLGAKTSPIGASIWNHVTGFLFMLLLQFLLGKWTINIKNPPFYIFIGGAIGAIYVSLANYLIPRTGTAKATILMIGGQIFLAAIIDLLKGNIDTPHWTLLGIALVISGVCIGELNEQTK